jgi:hypothetical protein
MMAEAKFYEAQNLAEVQLSLQDPSIRKELLPIYLEIIEHQNKKVSPALLLEVAENEIDSNIDLAQSLINKITTTDSEQYYRRIHMLQIKIAEKKGSLAKLYKLISGYHLKLYEARVPAQLELIQKISDKYFKHDFHIKLQELATSLLLGNLSEVEVSLNALILSCYEKATPRGRRDKFKAIKEVLASQREKNYLEIYSNFLNLNLNGIKIGQDYKRLVEMVIYFDDFKFQVLLLNLLIELGLDEVVEDYALEIKANSEYDFVYLDKYFNHLKKYFFQVPLMQEAISSPLISEQDLKLEGMAKDLEEKVPEELEEYSEEETLLVNSIKYHNYPPKTLIELSISFLQAECFHAATETAGLAMEKTSNDEEFLKACYLKLTGLFQLRDYRAVLDLSFLALEKSKNQDDILSFQYLQAETYLKLDNKVQARRILRRISEIDAEYRLTSERLKRLNEV